MCYMAKVAGYKVNSLCSRICNVSNVLVILFVNR